MYSRLVPRNGFRSKQDCLTMCISIIFVNLYVLLLTPYHPQIPTETIQQTINSAFNAAMPFLITAVNQQVEIVLGGAVAKVEAATNRGGVTTMAKQRNPGRSRQPTVPLLTFLHHAGTPVIQPNNCLMWNPIPLCSDQFSHRCQ